MYFLPIISLLFIGDTGKPMLVGHRADNQSLRCHNCPANNPNCFDICIGRYCYKVEFIADGYTTVKRGCLNQTDSGIRVGACEETPSDLPGSDFPAIDRMCGQNLEKSRSVWVEQGLLLGKIYKLADTYVQIFRGIPYAEAPIGPLRFKRPVKRARWHQEYAALDYGAPCLQFMEFHKNDKFAGSNMQNESEDCLYLNVFTPYDPEEESKLYPVVVWIHGGSFLVGSGDTGIDMEVITKHFTSNGVALVTLNYRLGLLGFINYKNNDHMEGNMGLWDLVMALEWIQTNMKQLNGDPSKITIMGESAGAAAVSALAVSPKTKGLLHQAIMLSGSSTAGWATHRFGQPAWNVNNIAAYLRCEKEFDKDRVQQSLKTIGLPTASRECNMQEKIPECLTENSEEMSGGKLVECFRNELNLSSFPFRLAIAAEHRYRTCAPMRAIVLLGVSKMIVDDELIPKSGTELISKYARVPIMIGVAQHEWAHKKAQEYGLHQFKDISIENCNRNIRKIINEQYIDTPENNRTLMRVVYGLQDLEADIEFVAPAQREIDGYVENGIPVYAYSFRYFPKSPIYEEDQKVFTIFGRETIKVKRKELQIRRNGRPRAFHGLNHAYIFTNGYSSNLHIEPFTRRDQQMAKMLAALITNFVKYGEPTPTEWNGFKWIPFTNESAQYAILDLPPKKAIGSLHWPATNFWNKETTLLEKLSLREKTVQTLSEELTADERLQLAAYRRAWWALWLLVGMIAFVIWITVICVVVTRCHSPRAKPYNNIVVNR
ncbi:Acetylcholinesterase [Dirofilaria immitis]|nr:Acetylcholinesterase [Dirofilaria immitis]